MPNTNSNRNSSSAPAINNGRKQCTSEKAKVLSLLPTYVSIERVLIFYAYIKPQRKLTTKKKNAQKAAECAKKKLHKKARTEEITRCLTNQENPGLYFYWWLHDTCVANIVISYRAIRHPAISGISTSC